MAPLPAVSVPAGVITALAIGLAAELFVRRARRLDLSGAVAFRAFLAAVAGGLLGGHLLFVATHGANGWADWVRAWGGQSVFGVLAGGTLGGVAYLRHRGLPVLRFADAAAPAVAAGYALARLGCLLHGDDFGVVTDVGRGIWYAPGTEAWLAHAGRGWIAPGAAASLPVVPVQALLALAGAAIAAALLATRRAYRPGVATGVACLAYGAARLGLEPLRDDFRAVLGPLSLPQILAVALAVAGAAMLVSARGRRAGAGDCAEYRPVTVGAGRPRREAQPS